MAVEAPLIIGRYALYDKVAAGGMATVFIGRLVGPVGFARTVAIKRLHPQFAADTEFVSMFLDEARLAARIHHPNVVSTLDVVATMGELFLVMDYVRGESLSALVRYANAAQKRIPDRIVAAIISGALQGLHAAHGATDEGGRPLGIVHRDVSPQNILVGVDGTPRVLDFGVAKAANRIHTTRGGEIKGKISYMPPEQLEGRVVDCRADIYSAGLVLFEVLTGQRMFRTVEDVAAISAILRNEVVLPSEIDPALAPWDAVVRRATARDLADRYETARAMALDVERVAGAASTVEVADFVDSLAGDSLKERTRRIAEIESSSGVAARTFGQEALVKELGSGSLPDTQEIVVEQGTLDRSALSVISHAVSVKGVVGLGRRRWPIAALSVAMIAALGVAVAARSRPASPASATAPPPPVMTESPTPPAVVPAVATAAPVPPSTAVAEPATPAAVADPPAAASGSPPAGRVPSVVAPAAVGPASRSRVAPPPKAASKPNCDRPTTVDSAGHTHFRPECL